MQPIRSLQLHTMFTTGTTRHIRRGEVFASSEEGDSVFYTISGFAKRYSVKNDGSLGIQILYGPQDIFPLTKVYRLHDIRLYDGPNCFYYEAISDMKILSVSSHMLQEALQTQPALYAELFNEAGRHLTSCVHSIENISLPNLYARTAHFLLFLFQKFGRPGAGSIQLELMLTHQDLADMLCAARPGVTLAITALRKNGLLDAGRQLATPDIAALREACYAL
jgi:CRP-like cAMP-binding protein